MLPAVAHRLVTLPRPVLPLTGVVVFLLLFLLDHWSGPLAPAAFPLMAILTGAALVTALMLPDAEEEDRRADLPITVTVVWILLFAVHAGWGLQLVMLLSWVGLIYYVGWALTHDVGWRWIGLAVACTLLLNLVLFFGTWRR